MEKQKNHISDLISSLRKQGAVILLESQMKQHPASKKSYLAAKPLAWIKAWGDKIEICEENKSRKMKGNPWEILKDFRINHHDWLFGYLGYDLKNYVEDLKSENPCLINAPDLFFMVPGLLLEIDVNGKIKILKGALPTLAKNKKSEGPFRIKLKSKISEDDYQNLVVKAKQDIFEGNYYEINLSHPLEFEFYGDSWDLYSEMKKIGPVPFGGYLHFDGIAVCSSSPERYLAKEGSRVWSQPIKGTATRQNNSDEADETLSLERFYNSEKERAENLMIVDLVRNDLARIAKKKSVEVSSLFEIQSFETVHQMVSTVECRVRKKTDVIKIIKTCFPMGSMTGAPKIATMKAIEAYENYKRGIYSGALGYIKPNDDFDFNVLIRTALIEENKLVYPVGGAITSDSDPNSEWRETLVKAKAITNIVADTE